MHYIDPHLRPPGAFRNRAGVDKSGHAITTGDANPGQWNTFLRTPGLDAAEANRRVAWLYQASAIDPKTTLKFAHKDKVTAPSLVIEHDGVTFTGWTWSGGNATPIKVTVKATSASAKITLEPAK